MSLAALPATVQPPSSPLHTPLAFPLLTACTSSCTLRRLLSGGKTHTLPPALFPQGSLSALSTSLNSGMVRLLPYHPTTDWLWFPTLPLPAPSQELTGEGQADHRLHHFFPRLPSPWSLPCRQQSLQDPESGMVFEVQTETGFMSTLSASSPGHLCSQMASLWTRGSSPIL